MTTKFKENGKLGKQTIAKHDANFIAEYNANYVAKEYASNMKHYNAEIEKYKEKFKQMTTQELKDFINDIETTDGVLKHRLTIETSTIKMIANNVLNEKKK